MFIIGNLLHSVASILNLLITIYIWLIIIRAILSWINPGSYHPLVQFLYRITEPVLGFVRQFIPSFGGLDLSPLIVILILYFVKNFVVKTLYQLAYYLQ